MTRIRILVALAAVMVLAGLLTLVGAVSSAAALDGDPRANCATETCEIYWAIPDSHGEVTWPQKLANPWELHCATWYQVDRYRSHPESVINNLIADGTLTQGEDYGIAISWRFEYGGDCQSGAINTPLPTETEEPSSPSTQPTAAPSTPPTDTSTTSTPPPTPGTTPTVEPTTPDTPISTPSTAPSQPTGVEAPSSPSSKPGTATPPLVTGGSTPSSNRLASTSGRNDGSWTGLGVLLVLAGLIIWVTAYKVKKH